MDRHQILSRRLLQLRAAKGLTRKEVAKALGLKSDRSLGHFEVGDSFPQMRILFRICEYYNVTPNQLLGFEEINHEKTIDTIGYSGFKFSILSD